MIEFRKATIEDIDLLTHWDQQEHVIASDPNDVWDWKYELSREPEWREQLIATHEGHPIGFLQIIDPEQEESQYWGEIESGKRAIDIWIGNKEDLGKGYGTQMMELAIKRCFTEVSVQEILIDPLASNQRAIMFYKRIGFEFVEKRRFGEDDCEVYLLKRETWQRGEGKETTYRDL